MFIIRKGWLVFFALVLLLSMLVWTGAASEPDTLVVVFPMDIASFDLMGRTAEPSEVRHLIFEPLFAFDDQMLPQPHLAESYEVSEDGLIWTFYLREGVRFHNGQPLTSADVVASWERYSQMGARAWEFGRVESVVAAGELAVEFRLHEPFGALMESLGMPSGTFVVYPKWVIDEIGTNDLVEQRHIVGTGPYTIDQIVPEERYVFRRYNNYTQPGSEPSFMAGNRNAPMEIIDIRIIPDGATRVAALEAGDVDLIHTVPPDDAARIDGNPNLYITITSPGQRLYFKFNATQGLFTDPLLREAVRAAVDAEAILLATGKPEFWRVNHAMRFQEEQWMWSDAAWKYYINDLDKAREMVAQSSYNGELIRFMVSPGRPLEFLTAIPMDQILRDLGLNVEMQSVDSATFSTVRRDLSQWEIKTSGGGSVVGLMYLDASVRDRSGNLWPGVPDAWHENLEIVIREFDQELRAQAVEQLHEIHAKLNNEMWIGDSFRIHGARTNVKNVSPYYKMVLWNTYKE